MAASDYVTDVQGLYVAYYGRWADVSGIDYWTRVVDADGGDLSSMVNQFGNSSEYENTYAEYLDDQGEIDDPSGIVTQLFQNMFDRAPDVDGLQFYVDALNSGESSLAEIALDIFNGAQNNDKAILDNKVTVAEYATAELEATNASYAGADDIAVAQSTLNNVTADGRSVVDAENTVESTYGGGGETFTLTTSIDNLTGTDGNDTFNGTLQGAGADGTTIQPGDTMNGLEGTDTLRISVAGEIDNGGNDYTLSAVDTNSVEKVLLSNFDQDTNDDNIVDTALMDGLETVGLSSSSADGDTVFTSLSSVVGAEMKNGAANLTLTYTANAISGASDVQTLAVSNLTAGAFTANGTETVNVTTSLVDSEMGTIASDSLESLVVSGDQGLTVGNAIAFASTNGGTEVEGTIDSSGLTGALDLTLEEAGNDSTVTLTGGAGDIALSVGDSLTENDTFDGGEGDNSLTMNLTGNAFVADQFAGVSNFGTVAIGVHDVTAGQAYDLSELPEDVATFDLELNDLDGNANDEVITNHTDQTIVLRNETADVGGNDTEVSVANQVDTDDDTLNLRVVEAVALPTTDIETLTADTYETVNLESTETADAGGITNRIDSLSLAAAETLTVTGDSALTIGATSATNLTALNAGDLTGGLTATLAAGDVDVTLGQEDSTVNFGSSFDANDSVVGGAGDGDLLTASGAFGTTNVAAALDVTDVETIELAASANDVNIDASSITGAEAIAFSQGNGQTTTLTNLAAGVTIGLGIDDAEAGGTYDISLADATGDADSLTFAFAEAIDADGTATLVASDIEAVTIVGTEDANNNDQAQTLDVTDLATAAITVTDGDAGSAIDLGTLNAATTSLDSSDHAGAITAVGGADVAMTVTANAAVVNTIDLQAEDDTVTLAGALGTVTQDIDAGGGTGDVLNATLDNAATDFETVENFETLNLTIADGAAAGFNDNNEDDGLNAATNINILGGNSVSSFTVGTAAVLADAERTVDATEFNGSIDMTFAVNALDSDLSIAAGEADDDTVRTSIAGTSNVVSSMTGVETLEVTSTDSDTAASIGLANVTGLVSLDTIFDDNSNADQIQVDDLAAGVEVSTTSSENGDNLVLNLASASGSDDAIDLSVEAFDTAGDTLNLDAAGAEVVNLTANNTTNAGAVDMAGVTATGDNSVTVDIGGAGAITIEGLTSDVSTVDGSDMTAALTLSAANRASDAMTITGGEGDDTIAMENASDVLDGGLRSDELVVDVNAILGGILVDLSSDGDQVTTVNGSSNTAVQQGFEDVDLSAYTGGNGAEVFGSSDDNEIVGTGFTDDLRGGAGNDIITGGAGDDSLTGGAGDDTFVYTASDEGADTSDFDDANDTIRFTADDQGGEADVFDEGDVVLAGTDPTGTPGTVVTVATTDFNSIAVGGDIEDNHVNVVTTAGGYADVSAALAAINGGAGETAGNGTSYLLAFFNSADEETQLHYVSDEQSGNTYDDTVSTELVALTGVPAADLGNIANTDFEVISLG